MEEKGMERNKNSQVQRMRTMVYQTIAAMFVVAVLIVLTVGSNIKLTSVEDERLSATQYTNQYSLGSKTLTYAVQAYAVTGEQEHYDDYQKELNQDKNRDIAWEGLKELNIRESEWACLEQVAELSNGLVPLEEKALAAVESGKQKSAISYVFGQEYEDTIQQINDLSDQAVQDIQDRMEIQISRLKQQQLIFEVLLVLSFLLIMFQVMRTIRFARVELLQPIVKVEKQMIELSRGNLKAEFDMTGDDSEVGRMVSAIFLMKRNLIEMIAEFSAILSQMGKGNFNIQIQKEYEGDFTQIKSSFLQIGQEMKETLQTIREVSDQIDQGSEQLANAAGDLAEGSSDQAMSVSELMSLIKEMAVNMKKNAEEAKESVSLTEEAGSALSVGNAKMQELKEAIAEINECSEQIGSIINSIDDIATQTNMLSLNAAIEAARAGEAGKGFAVVAEEVKSLAAESSEAAGKTSELIEKTIRAVSKGIGIADETAANMDDVMKAAQKVTKRMEEVALLLKKDVDGMGQVDLAIRHVSEVVDSNSAASEETAAVSEEQKAQVEMMVSLMDKFRI